MTALSAISAQAIVMPAVAAASAFVPPPTSAETDDLRPAQVSPESSRNVTPEAIAAIQSLGSGDSEASDTTRQAAPENQPKSYQELLAEARRWERYYAHQPRRLADLLAVYYGGHPGSPDARGPDVSRSAEDEDSTDAAAKSKD